MWWTSYGTVFEVVHAMRRRGKCPRKKWGFAMLLLKGMHAFLAKWQGRLPLSCTICGASFCNPDE